MSQLVLSLFPGIGLLDMAFEQEGFCVVRGPDVLWGGDIRRFHPLAGRFDGVIGGPPCQAFSRMRRLLDFQGKKKAPNLIPEFERCIRESQPAWFLMENVEGAPLASVVGYITRALKLNNRWLGEEQNRVRVFSFGSPDGKILFPKVAVFESSSFAQAVTARGGQRAIPVKLNGNGKCKIGAADLASKRSVQESIRLQGLPEDFLADAPFTVDGKQRVIGNGVPLPMGRAVARAVKEAIS